MKLYRLLALMLIGLLYLTSGLVLAQDAAPGLIVTELPADMETALMPCGEDVTGPCDMIATKAEDIVGVWVQYLLFPPDNTRGSRAYIRYNADGTIIMADSIENTAQPMEGFPSTTFRFEGTHLIFDAIPSAPAPCNGEGIFQVRVLKYGDVPVALRYVAISDDCPFRLQDFVQAAVWVAE